MDHDREQQIRTRAYENLGERGATGGAAPGALGAGRAVARRGARGGGGAASGACGRGKAGVGRDALLRPARAAAPALASRRAAGIPPAAGRGAMIPVAGFDRSEGGRAGPRPVGPGGGAGAGGGRRAAGRLGRQRPGARGGRGGGLGGCRPGARRARSTGVACLVTSPGIPHLYPRAAPGDRGGAWTRGCRWTTTSACSSARSGRRSSPSSTSCRG